MDFSQDIAITAVKQDLRFRQTKPTLVLKRGVTRNIFGNVPYRLSVHLKRLVKIGKVKVEQLSAEEIDAAHARMDEAKKNGENLQNVITELQVPSSEIKVEGPSKDPEKPTSKKPTAKPKPKPKKTPKKKTAPKKTPSAPPIQSPTDDTILDGGIEAFINDL